MTLNVTRNSNGLYLEYHDKNNKIAAQFELGNSEFDQVRNEMKLWEEEHDFNKALKSINSLVDKFVK